MTRLRRILIVVADDDETRAVRPALERSGFEIVAAADYDEAYTHLLGSRFDLVVTECGPDRDGIEFIRRVRATTQLAGILILAVAEWGEGEATLALSQGADGYEPKPIDANRLITSIERLLHEQAAAAGQTNE